MAVERFTKQEFEDALPLHKETGAKLWEYKGVDNGEAVYIMRVGKMGGKDIVISIRSSVGHNGVSKDTGEDSIRAWASYEDGKPVPGSKIQNYVQRLPGWDIRLKDMLRKLYFQKNSLE